MAPAGGVAAAQAPWFVCFLAAGDLLADDPAAAWILREGPGLGAVCVVVAEAHHQLPRECRAILRLTAAAAEGEAWGEVAGPGGEVQPFVPDRVPVEQADRLARALAPVRLCALDSGQVPAHVTLFQVLGMKRLEDLNPLARWAASAPDQSLAVAIGCGTGGQPVLLDLHERGDGPHGLVAGSTGSGKSDLLQILLVALAAQFHPHEVAFVVVDYKGGGMAGPLQGLPHLLGTLTNLDGPGAARALAALRAEIRRRQRLLAAAGVDHLDKYLRARRQGAPLPPLPHLVLVVDEFAELKASQPAFIRELVSAARVGRSLGVHLLLATQKPAGVVDDQIWSNARFRICLRVEHPQDSQEVLRSPAAAGLAGPGRGFLQVGMGDRFVEFQAAWGGAPLASQGEAPMVAALALDGARLPMGPQPDPDAAGATVTQLQAVVGRIAAAAQAAGVERLPSPWLPPLPDQVDLAALPVGDGTAPGGGRWTAGCAHR